MEKTEPWREYLTDEEKAELEEIELLQADMKKNGIYWRGKKTLLVNRAMQRARKKDQPS